MGRKPTKHSPKKPSFFKVLLGDFSKHLWIPPQFTKNHIRLSLIGECGLRGPSGKCWNVKLERKDNGVFFHDDGWHTFVKDHLLEEGDFLVFHYDGESNFEVTLYDKTCGEKVIEVPKRRRGRPKASKQGNAADQVKAVEVIDLEAENYHKNVEMKTNFDGRRSGNYFMPGQEIRIKGVNQTSPGYLFKSKNACWKLILKRKAQTYTVVVPKEVVTAADLMNKKIVEVQDPTGRSWPVKLLTITSKQQNGRSSDRLDMSTGWSKCCKANKMSVGDTVIFEYMKHGVMRLHSYGKGPGRM